jgi:hypothetical protein
MNCGIHNRVPSLRTRIFNAIRHPPLPWRAFSFRRCAAGVRSAKAHREHEAPLRCLSRVISVSSDIPRLDTIHRCAAGGQLFSRVQVIVHRNVEIHQLGAFRIVHPGDVEVRSGERGVDILNIKK